MTCKLSRCRQDGSRWSIRHEIFKENGELAAIINADGAWIDQIRRKLAPLPEDFATSLLTLDKTEDYVEEVVTE